MKSLLVALVFLAALTWAPPADCDSCSQFIQCFGDYICGEGCRCMQPNGPGSAGFCG